MRTCGNCWASGGHYGKNADKEPTSLLLDQLIEAVSPSISFLKYKNLIQTLEKLDEFTDDEYYGNSTNYGVKYIIVQELYDYLKEKELI